MESRLCLFNHQGVAIGLATQSIGHNIGLAGLIIKDHIIVFDSFQPSSLSQVQIRLGEKILQTLMIRVDLTTVAQQVGPPLLQSVNYGSKL